MAETLRTSAKNAHNKFYRFGYLLTNDTISKVIPNDLDLLFQGEILQILVYRKHWELAHTSEIILNTWHFSNFLIF